MELHKIELHVAFQWDCDSCGAENFCRGVIHEMSPEDQQEIAAGTRTEPGFWQTGDLIACPEEVTCKDCGCTFETTNPYADDE